MTGAWTLLLGDELHYGLFAGAEELAAATHNLTRLMLEVAQIERTHTVLDVGCGTGAPACCLARETGARVVGITTSRVGLEMARTRAEAEGLEETVEFDLRDGADNGFGDASFDRAWVLETSHLVDDRPRLIGECARVLRPGGRLALCDVVLRRRLEFAEIRRRRKQLMLLRDVFGAARMEPVTAYREHLLAARLEVERELDLSEQVRPTFARWRENADRHRDEVVGLLGEGVWRDFLAASEALDALWDEEVLGYALISAVKP